MTLAGQEARIQLRFRIPDHPQNDLYKRLCEEYKRKSEEQLQKLETHTKVKGAMQAVEAHLDKTFTERLKELDKNNNLE